MPRPIWWRLPGPADFVDRIVRDLRDGKNVVACLPEFAPDGLVDAVRRGMDEDRFWDHLDIDADDPRSAIDQAYRSLLPNEDHPGAIRNAGTLVRDPRMLDRGVTLDGFHALPVARCREWIDILAEYSHGCRSMAVADRPVFIALLRGQASLAPPPSDACLALHRWDGVVDHLDMLLYVSALRRWDDSSPVRRRLAISVVSHIAAWDPQVAEQFAFARLEQILEPDETLRGIAAERCWTRGAAPADTIAGEGHWANGMVATVEGDRLVHSALLIGHPPGAHDWELARRMWSAEVGVLLPYVEEQRRAIIERYRDALILPHYRPGDRSQPIYDVLDLELGDLHFQMLHLHVNLGAESRTVLPQLKEIRNLLAHLQPLPLPLISGLP